MAPNSLLCADVILRTYTLTHEPNIINEINETDSEMFRNLQLSFSSTSTITAATAAAARMNELINGVIMQRYR